MNAEEISIPSRCEAVPEMQAPDTQRKGECPVNACVRPLTDRVDTVFVRDTAKGVKPVYRHHENI